MECLENKDKEWKILHGMKKTMQDIISERLLEKQVWRLKTTQLKTDGNVLQISTKICHVPAVFHKINTIFHENSNEHREITREYSVNSFPL